MSEYIINYVYGNEVRIYHYAADMDYILFIYKDMTSYIPKYSDSIFIKTSEQFYNDAVSYVRGESISRELFHRFLDLFGFVPIAGDCIGYGISNVMLKVSSFDEYKRVETVYTNFIGVRVPLAFTNMMETVQGMKFACPKDEFTIDHIPEELLCTAQESIQKLNTENGEVNLTNADIKLYNFLGMVKLLELIGVSVFISGDALLVRTLANTIQAGYFDDAPLIKFVKVQEGCSVFFL
jgi:hypothetical protein